MTRKYPHMVMVVALLWAMLVHVTRLLAAEPIRLGPELQRLSLGMHMDILEDTSKQWTIHDIVSQPIAALFTPSRAQSPSFGFTSSAYWVRFAVVNPSDRDIQWYLEIAYPPMDRIDLYIAAPPEPWQSRRFGDHLPFNARDVKFRNFIVRLHTAPQSQQHYYIRFENAGPMNLPLTILSASALSEKINNEQIALGLYHGAILVMLVYNLFIFLSIRDASYLYYVLFNSGWVLAMLTLNGLAFQYLWPRSVWWANHGLLFFFCFAFLWGVQFGRSFLDTVHHTPSFDMVLRGLMVLAGLGMACALLAPYSLSVRLTNMIGMTSIVMWINGFLCWLRGVRTARSYIVAWSALIAGIAMLSLKNFGVLPHNTFTIWAPQFGSAMEIVLLSFGLADRIRTLRREKEQAEKALIDTRLAMQDTMLKEVHHRVKNNLQVIASLLNLQAHYVRDARAFEMFKESQQRVQSMALIHERLYHADDTTRIDFTDYTRALAAHLLSSYSPSSAAIALQLHVDNITLGIDTAIPCGLIIHELVANALKHAFPAGQAGEIRLVIRASGAARFLLLVSDNGIGFPPSIDFRHTESLGLRLVHTLTEQLDGTIEWHSNGGTTVTITFAELIYTQRG